RLFWLQHAATPRGRLVLDHGAVAAVVQRRASLLPAGIVAVSGDFDAGDPEEPAGPAGAVLPRGHRGYGGVALPGSPGPRPPGRPTGAGKIREQRRQVLVGLGGIGRGDPLVVLVDVQTTGAEVLAQQVCGTVPFGVSDANTGFRGHGAATSRM